MHLVALTGTPAYGRTELSTASAKKRLIRNFTLVELAKGHACFKVKMRKNPKTANPRWWLDEVRSPWDGNVRGWFFERLKRMAVPCTSTTLVSAAVPYRTNYRTKDVIGASCGGSTGVHVLHQEAGGSVPNETTRSHWSLLAGQRAENGVGYAQVLYRSMVGRGNKKREESTSFEHRRKSGGCSVVWCGWPYRKKGVGDTNDIEPNARQSRLETAGGQVSHFACWMTAMRSSSRQAKVPEISNDDHSLLSRASESPEGPARRRPRGKPNTQTVVSSVDISYDTTHLH